MRKLIKEADPDVVEEWKWMGTPSLKDPARLFNSSLDGNARPSRRMQARADRESVQPESVTHVSGLFCYPSPRTIPLPLPTEKTAGYQQLVRGEPMRAKFRNSRARPEPMPSNQVTPVTFEMPDVNHTFRRGHRIMVQIQSSWFPLTDLNPQTFVDLARARSTDFVKATERVYHTPTAASRIVVGVLSHR